MSDDEYDGPIPAADPNAGEHALFWDEMPDNPEEDSTFQAMEALKEESTLEEKAEQCKVGHAAAMRASCMARMGT